MDFVTPSPDEDLRHDREVADFERVLQKLSRAAEQVLFTNGEIGENGAVLHWKSWVPYFETNELSQGWSKSRMGSQ